MTMAYLSGWQGPVPESEDPYGDAYSPDGLQPCVHVQEIRSMKGATLSQIKSAVSTYGAVQTSLHMDRSMTKADSPYYSSLACAFYDPKEETPSHDVLIVGWDDDYSRFHFKQLPDQNGAFICQNSWGSDFGEDGIFYVSYEDANIAKDGLVYTRIDGTDNYDFIYQQDECGWQGSQGYAQESCWFSAVYTASSDEEMAAAGFYATEGNTSYKLYIVHDFEGSQSFQQMELLQEGRFESAGYYTVDLKQPISLEEGERFAVVVSIATPGAESPVAVEYRADAYTQNVTTQGKESYLSQYGETWENTQQSFGTNVCLKVYTKAGTQAGVQEEE